MNIRRIVPDITTDRFDESKKFYTEYFGFRLAMDLGWVITFVSSSNITAQITFVKGQPVPMQDIPITLTIEVEDVDAMHARAIEQGIKIIYPLRNEPWGVRRFHVLDPNGITINVMMHIP